MILDIFLLALITCLTILSILFLRDRIRLKKENLRIHEETLALQMWQERYLLATQDLDVLILDINYEEEKINVNENFYKLFGSEPSYALFESFGRAHPDDAPLFKKLQDDVYQKQENVSGELRLRVSSGDYEWFNLAMHPVVDANGNTVRSVCRLTNVTQQHNETELLRLRAQIDAHTSLLNKAATEEMISFELKEYPERSQCLIICDLDDLKIINDQLGHLQGDKALTLMADTLKRHFDENAIIGRVGGDEFMIFLPLAPDEASLKSSILSLRRKIGLLQVGEKDDYPIHCSLGVSFTKTNDTFVQIYKRADLALYYCKRSGKNSYAFYRPEMEVGNYQHQRPPMPSLRQAEWLDSSELNRLLHAISMSYPFIISTNLTKDYYYIMENQGFGTTYEVPESGSYSELVEKMAQSYHPDDRDAFYEAYLPENLFPRFENGEVVVGFEGRQLDENQQYHWVNSKAIFQKDENTGDVELISFARSVDFEKKLEFEQLRLKKIMEIIVAASFEYICIIHTETEQYELYANDGKDTHKVMQVANFEEATISIRDTAIAPEDRETYYNNATLSTVMQKMNETNGHYHYRYKILVDGHYEWRAVNFYYYNNTRKELLMTVRKLENDEIT